MESITKPDDCAFAVADEAAGLSKREYFASAALQGILTEGGVHVHVDVLSDLAVKLADALINRLNHPAK